jgi:cytochrome oxidase Cu insertion factor (SCO1/SenC/PrrC family)
MRRIWLTSLAMLFGLAVAAAQEKGKDSSKADSPKKPEVNKEAPDIAGPDTDGKDFKLSDYRGKVVMLDFWGHW